jgi:tryptophanyl-tRNA synthetase
MYKAQAVPVGIDQVPHVEITREIARRFNYLYGEIFPEPESLLTETPKILGLDRRKMSKSYDNAIYMADGPERIRSRVSEMITDPQRMRRKDPGNPDVCNVYEFHRQFSDPATVERVGGECRAAEIGCVECKKLMAENLIQALAPIREKRAYYETHPERVEQIIAAGDEKARCVARQTMDAVRAALNL